MTSNSRIIENVFENNKKQIEDDIEEIAKILKLSIGLVTQPTSKVRKTSLRSAIIKIFKYYLNLLNKYLRFPYTFEKKSNLAVAISLIVLFIVSYFLDVRIYIIFKHEIMVFVDPVHPVVHHPELISPLIIPDLVLANIVFFVLTLVSLVFSVVSFTVRYITELSSLNSDFDRIKTTAKEDLQSIVSLSRFSPQSLKYYALQINYRIKLAESNDKIISNVLPILAIFYAIFMIYEINSITFTGFFNISSFSTITSYLLTVSPIVLLIFKLINEFDKQRLIRLLEKCLIMIEQAILMGSKTNS